MLRFWTVCWNNMKSFEAKSIIISPSFLFYLRNIFRFYGSESLNCRSKEDKIRQLNITRDCNCWGRGEFCFFSFQDDMIVFVLRSHFLEQPWKRAWKWINKLISEWASERVVACVREWVSKRLIERESW